MMMRILQSNEGMHDAVSAPFGERQPQCVGMSTGMLIAIEAEQGERIGKIDG